MAKDKKKELHKDSGQENLNRRKFFVAAGNAAIGIAALGSLGVSLDYLVPEGFTGIAKAICCRCAGEHAAQQRYL